MEYQDKIADKKLRELAQKESDCVGDDRRKQGMKNGRTRSSKIKGKIRNTREN